ncbi:MAG: molybdopterin-dependent oxidoreductase [Heliobacteriaceae bacterium]|nr:molybdopterin-dependent oxidoreductase [Heliobacteriaceae bacterium]
MNIGRRGFLKLTGTTGLGLALSELGFDIQKVEAAAQEFKLKDAQEYTSVCHYCACGCGVLAYVKEGKLIHLEGEPENIINEGALCSKGVSQAVIPNSDQRIKTPLYRAPGSNKWQEISWEEAYDRIAKKTKETREKYWIATEKNGDTETKVNRCDAIGFVGGAQIFNEECYLLTKYARLIGTDFIEHQARV